MEKLAKYEINGNWYFQLLSDLKKLAFEGIVKTKHAIGKRIIEDELKFNKPEYGSKRIENLAKDLNVSRSELFCCIQFAKNYELSDISDNLTWYEITHKLLPEHKKEPIKTPPLPKGKFNVIYADPPWQYSNVGLGGSAEKHYPTLSVDEIINFKDRSGKSVLELIPKNAVLFLWTPNSFLEEGLQVCKEWGFDYKTNFVWVKQKSAYGKLAFYNYGQHEFLFLGIKGSLSPQEESLVPSILYAEKTAHSKKPEKMYEIIETMYPFPEEEKPYCELFARNRRKRWKSWGLEVNKYEK